MKSRIETFELKTEGNDTAYLKLPTYPNGGLKKVSKTTRLFDYIGKYEGPDVIFDFDEDGVLVGIEVLAD